MAKTSFRQPDDLHQKALKECEREDITFLFADVAGE
jgi:hypothetical protein